MTVTRGRKTTTIRRDKHHGLQGGAFRKVTALEFRLRPVRDLGFHPEPREEAGECRDDVFKKITAPIGDAAIGQGRAREIFTPA